MIFISTYVYDMHTYVSDTVTLPYAYVDPMIAYKYM